jgi:hypothetical protein
MIYSSASHYGSRMSETNTPAPQRARYVRSSRPETVPKFSPQAGFDHERLLSAIHIRSSRPCHLKDRVAEARRDVVWQRVNQSAVAVINVRHRAGRR